MDPAPDHGSHVPGGSHRQADLQEELAADGIDLTPERDEIDIPGGTPTDDLLERSELAIFLRPSIFPASASSLLETAKEEHAPPEILERLQRLPLATYQTVQEVWVALGGSSETRDIPPTIDAAPFEAHGSPVQDGTPSPLPATPSWVDGVAHLAGHWTETTVRVVLGGAVAVLSNARKHVTLPTWGE
jgi:hypothetical protein